MWCWTRPESEPGTAEARQLVRGKSWPTWRAPPGRPCQPHPLAIQTLGSGSQRYSQTHAGVGRKHVDVVLTQRVDDDGLAPVHQVGCKLENLRAEGLAAQCLGGGPTGLLSGYPTSRRVLGAAAHTAFSMFRATSLLTTGPCAVWDCHFLLGPRTVLAGTGERSYTHRDNWDTQGHRVSSAEQGSWLDILAEAGSPPHQAPAWGWVST